MLFRSRNATICLLAVAAAFMAAVSVTPQPRLLVITHVNVVDVVDGRLLPDRTVTISGETITGLTQDSPPPADARLVDGRGKFLIPGLWDMHAHMEMTGESSLSCMWQTAWAPR